MNDTPRTDAEEQPDGYGYTMVDARLARELERELSASSAKVTRLEALLTRAMHAIDMAQRASWHQETHANITKLKVDVEKEAQ